ncbi:MAG TPA: MlaD family protein [Chthoniobacterales bacterium]|jgi:ABC-type transporter Mla subunit MlaD
MQLRRNEILTGLLVVATLAILTGVLVLLGAPGLFRPLTTYKIYFDNAAGIKLGAPVLLAGRKIGQVAKLYSPVSKAESQRAIEVARALHTVDPNATPAPPTEKPPRFEVRIDVQVDRNAQLYRDSKARMITLGLLGETAIDFTEGTEASGRASSGEVFAGERVPDFGEAIAKVLEVVQPVATEATATFKQLELTAQNLSHITDESSQLNLALVQFRTFGEHLNELTAEDGSLSKSLSNIQRITNDLTKNDNIKVTLQNFRESSEKLKATMNSLEPSLQESGHNIKDATALLRSEPWRLVWPSTKKYPEGQQAGEATTASAKPVKAGRSSPKPTRRSTR